jgi:hypothetical protein
MVSSMMARSTVNKWGSPRKIRIKWGISLVALDGIKLMNYKNLYNSTGAGQHGQEEGFAEPTWC